MFDFVKEIATKCMDEILKEGVEINTNKFNIKISNNTEVNEEPKLIRPIRRVKNFERKKY